LAIREFGGESRGNKAGFYCSIKKSGEEKSLYRKLNKFVCVFFSFVLKMSTPKRKRNLLDFRQKREIVEIKNPSIYWQMMSSSDLDFLNINEK
jgi:hypothetical protein